MIEFEIKHQSFQKQISLDPEMKLGDALEKTLHICSIFIYDLDSAECIMNNNEKILLGEEADFNSVIGDLKGIVTLELIPRIRDNKHGTSLSPFIEKYNEYIMIREDERYARSLEEEMNQPSHALHYLNNLIQNEGNLPSITISNNNHVISTPGNTTGGITTDQPNILSLLSNLHSTQNMLNSIHSSLSSQMEESEEGESPNDTQETPPSLQTLGSLIGNGDIGITAGQSNIATNLPPFSIMANNFMNYLAQNLANDSSSQTESEGSQISPGTDTFSQMLQNMFEMTDVRVVNTEEELKQIKTTKFEEFKNTGQFNGESCSICLSDFEDLETLMVLHCDHFFHQECAKKWLSESKNICPICRERVFKGEPKDL